MAFKNDHLFKRALDKIQAEPNKSAQWDRPWKNEGLQMPDDETVGIPYHHVLQVRRDIEQLIRRHSIDLRLSETIPGYCTGTDQILIPRPSSFKSKAMWYQTLFHEMGHWTGSRIGRGSTMMINHPVINSAEEVVAELTSAFLCEAYDIKGEQHARYIDGFVGNVPPKFLKTVMAQAVKATNYLLQK